MWAAARPRLPKESVLYAADPLPIRAVLNLAGTADMAAYIPLENHACGSAVIEDVMGGKPNQFPERYAQASAIKLLPLGLPQLIVWGHEDDVVPMSFRHELYPGRETRWRSRAFDVSPECRTL